MESSFTANSLHNYGGVDAAAPAKPRQYRFSAAAVADASAKAATKQQAGQQAGRKAARRRGNLAGRIFERILAAADEKKFSLMYLFARYDKDASGELDPAEFQQALWELRVLLRPSELEAVMAELDTDGDGSVSISEFYSRMRLAQKDRFVSAASPAAAAAAEEPAAGSKKAARRGQRFAPRRAATSLGHTELGTVGQPEYASRHRCVVSWDPHNNMKIEVPIHGKWRQQGRPAPYEPAGRLHRKHRPQSTPLEAAAPGPAFVFKPGNTQPLVHNGADASTLRRPQHVPPLTLSVAEKAKAAKAAMLRKQLERQKQLERAERRKSRTAQAHVGVRQPPARAATICQVVGLCLWCVCGARACALLQHTVHAATCRCPFSWTSSLEPPHSICSSTSRHDARAALSRCEGASTRA